ncbi:MAG: hypothetical protein ACHQX4_12055 [Gemmatimonadales bacterium]
MSIWLGINGGFVLVALTGALIGALFGSATLRAAIAEHPVRVVVAGGVGLTLCLAARDLSHQLRRGAYSALLAFGLPLVGAVGGAPVSAETLVISVLGLAAVASVWSQLE